MARSASPRAALRSKPDHFVPPDVGSSVQPYQEQGAKERECARESRRSAPRKPLPSGISSGRPALDPIVARHLTMPPFCPAAALSEAYREVYEAARDQKRRRRRRQTVEVRATIDPASAVSQAEFLLLPGGSAESVLLPRRRAESLSHETTAALTTLTELAIKSPQARASRAMQVPEAG